MVLVEFFALFLCGTFFGAAVYISIAQHPASIRAGVPVAAKFFPPMYDLAAPMQITLAVGGTLAGLIQWYLVSDALWAIGAALLVFVIPFTLIVLKPINDQLLDSNAERVWSKNSCGRSVVELQEATETLAASHGPVLAHLLARKEEEVVLPLVIPLAVEVFDIRAQRGS